MNKTQLIIFVVVLVTTAACTSHRHYADFSDWTSVGEAQWVQQPRAVRSSSEVPLSYLVSSQVYRDYQLDIEFYPNAEVNSGVFLNCQSATEIDATQCHEVNIWDNHPRQEFRTGSIVGKVFPPKQHLNTLDKWNRYSIVVQQGSVRVTLNGQETAYLAESDLSEGYLALQKAEGGEIKFRNLMITPL